MPLGQAVRGFGNHMMRWTGTENRKYDTCHLAKKKRREKSQREKVLLSRARRHSQTNAEQHVASSTREIIKRRV